MTHSEQQRRTVLANLAADVSHIRQYCALRDPTGILRGASVRDLLNSLGI